MVNPVYSSILEQDILDYLVDVREIERDELDATSSLTLEEAVRESVANSDVEISRAVRVDGELMCLFGVSPTDTNIGIPWFLATNAIHKYNKSFIKHIKIGIIPMLDKYDLLYNIIDSRNTTTTPWLRMLGFTMLHEFEMKKGYPVTLFELRRT